MSRSRSERRHNDRVKARRLHTLADKGCWGIICSAKVAPNGERWSCPLCKSSKTNYERQEHAHLEQLKLEAFVLAQA